MIGDFFDRYESAWGAWVIAIGLALILYFAFTTILHWVHRRVVRFAAGDKHPYAQALVAVLGRSNRLIFALVAFLVAVRVSAVVFPGAAWADAHLWFALLVIQFALWLDKACSSTLTIVATRTRASRITTTLLAYLLRTLLWTVTLLAMLDNLGVNITAFIASLGIGGVAVALAVQTILADLFASIAIGLDKPFEVDDFIVFGQVAGSIEYIGLKTTRIRSLGGEQIVCSNTELLKQTIQNYKRMEQRRVVFTLRVPYGTATDTLAQLPEDVSAQIKAQPDTRFDRAHIARFGDWALEIEAVYYVMSADYNRFMDIQQEINLGILRAFEARGVDLQPVERAVHLLRPPRPKTASEQEAPAPGMKLAPPRPG